MTRIYNQLATATLIGLIAFGLAWELWLAPLRPGGSTLALKVVPLLIPLFGILRGQRYTHQWLSLLSLIYAGEGLIRIGSQSSNEQTCAAFSLLLSVLLFIGCVGYAHSTRPSAVKPAD